MYRYLLLVLAGFLVSTTAFSQNTDELLERIDDLEGRIQSMRYSFQSLEKSIDDVAWFHKLGDQAYIDKVELTGPPMGEERGKAMGGSYNPTYYTNPLRIKTYVFIPKDIDPDKKYPLLVLPHGGVHSNFNTGYAHIVRELIAQHYIVVAPEYRGSTGYGSTFYRAIDYGGLEIQDVKACRDYMLDNYMMVDKDRVGILGWSHGGLITLMNIFEYPDDYQVAYAGVPVSDLIARMGYKTDGYRRLYSVDYHIGKTAHEDPEEYMRRSPAWNAEKLQDIPLLIHTNTNDADVGVLEVEHLIKALKAADKDFAYEIYEDQPGGHRFDRMDTQNAKQLRLKVYRFLAKELNPDQPFSNLQALQKASYGFK